MRTASGDAQPCGVDAVLGRIPGQEAQPPCREVRGGHHQAVSARIRLLHVHLGIVQREVPEGAGAAGVGMHGELLLEPLREEVAPMDAVVQQDRQALAGQRARPPRPVLEAPVVGGAEDLDHGAGGDPRGRHRARDRPGRRARDAVHPVAALLEHLERPGQGDALDAAALHHEVDPTREVLAPGVRRPALASTSTSTSTSTSSVRGGARRGVRRGGGLRGRHAAQARGEVRRRARRADGRAARGQVHEAGSAKRGEWRVRKPLFADRPAARRRACRDPGRTGRMCARGDSCRPAHESSRPQKLTGPVAAGPARPRPARTPPSPRRDPPGPMRSLAPTPAGQDPAEALLRGSSPAGRSPRAGPARCPRRTRRARTRRARPTPRRRA